MHARVVLGVGKGVLFREVSSVQERERFLCIGIRLDVRTCTICV